ncbi:MAG TPA: FecR family protein [Planctomycetota bacterium]|nr:FecR family protein [Planctomycetota bacterium]
MSATGELDTLINRLVDDQLDDAGTTRLQDVLRGDALARRRYRQVLALHANLQWDYVAAARDSESVPVQSTAGRWWLPWTTAAAAALVAAVVFAWWPTPAATVLLTTSSLSNGTLTWSDGTTQRTLDAADGMPAGRLVLEGGSAVAVLRFVDDTTLTLTGDSEMAVEAPVEGKSGKHLDLRRGTLSAEVAHQPAGEPLVVTTATARVEVVGTQFTVGMGSDTTTLAVEQGLVRFERLADHQTVEVAAGQQSSVSFDATMRITVLSRPQIPSTWHVDFAQRPPMHWSGTWTAPADGSVGWFSSEPYTAGRDANGKPFIHHGVRINADQGTNRPFVRLHADSRLTMRFRMLRGDSRTQVKVMLCMMKDGAAFGGSFFANVDPQALPADAEGWRTTVLAMSAFVPTRPTIHPSVIGSSVTFILANTAARPAGLEVASLAVDQP